MISGKTNRFTKQSGLSLVWLFFGCAFAEGGSSDSPLTAKFNANRRCENLFVSEDKLLNLWQIAEDFKEKTDHLIEPHPLRAQIIRFYNFVERAVDGRLRMSPARYAMAEAEAEVLQRLLQEGRNNLSQASVDEVRRAEPFFIRTSLITNSERSLSAEEQTHRHKNNKKIISDNDSYERIMADPALITSSAKYDLGLPPGPVRWIQFSDKAAKALSGKNKNSRFVSQHAVSFLRAAKRGFIGVNGKNGIKKLKGGDNNLYEIKIVGKAKGGLRLVGFLHENVLYIIEYVKDTGHSGRSFQAVLDSVKKKSKEISDKTAFPATN